MLVDAPCSAERERLGDDITDPCITNNNFAWCPRKVRSNAARQVRILSAALRRVTHHGCVVYATCALTDIENDDVIAVTLAKAPRGWDTAGCHLPVAAMEAVPHVVTDCIERTRYGWRVLPDRGGWGPMYWAVLQRRL